RSTVDGLDVVGLIAIARAFIRLVADDGHQADGWIGGASVAGRDRSGDWSQLVVRRPERIWRQGHGQNWSSRILNRDLRGGGRTETARIGDGEGEGICSRRQSSLGDGGSADDVA